MSQEAYEAFLAELRAEPDRCSSCGFHSIQGHREGCETFSVSVPPTAYGTHREIEDVPLPLEIERPW